MLSAPYKGASPDLISQTYHSGHEALDLVSAAAPFIRGYGTPLCALEKCQVIMIRGDLYNPDNYDDETRGFSIWLKGLETGFTYFFHHLQPILPVRLGDMLERGQIAAFMGNSGNVFESAVHVPIEQRDKPYRGTHLHLELYDTRYRLGGPKRFLNPLDYIDWKLQPTYTNADHLKALAVVVGKAAGLLSKL